MSTNPISKRTLSREYAFKFLYKNLMPEFQSEKDDFLNNRSNFNLALSEFDKSFSEMDDEHPNNVIDNNSKNFAEELILGALISEKDSRLIIEKFLTNKKLEKVDRMNLTVLLLGVYEIKTDKTSSPGIFINEYVNIAKKYCPPESAGFINSVLDKIAKE
jgi:N utilization substance protein B